MGKRKSELSISSIIFMLLVIFIHIAAECVDGYVTESFQFAIICSLHRLASFVVQGFIFLSGLKLFLSYKEDFSYGKFYVSRFKRVVLPYLAVFSLFYIYFIATHSVSPSLSHFLTELVTGGLVGHFYFVAIICQFYLLMPLWRLLYRRGNAMLAVTASLVIMILCKEYLPTAIYSMSGYQMKYNSRLFTYYLFYFVAGIFAGKYYDTFMKFLRRRKLVIYISTALVGLVDCALIYLIRRGLYYPSWAENWHVLYCMLAIMSTVSLAISLSKAKLAETEVIKLLDSASYNVYLIHPLLIFFIDSVSNRLGITSLTLRLIIKGAFTLIFAVGGCLLIEIIKGTSNAKAKKILYYLSPFVWLPVTLLAAYLFDEVIGAPSFFGLVVYALIAIVSFFTARRSSSHRRLDLTIAIILAVSLFAFMLLINFLDAGETYSRFDIRHALRNATQAGMLIGYAICFISGLVGSLKIIRNK